MPQEPGWGVDRCKEKLEEWHRKRIFSVVSSTLLLYFHKAGVLNLPPGGERAREREREPESERSGHVVWHRRTFLPAASWLSCSRPSSPSTTHTSFLRVLCGGIPASQVPRMLRPFPVPRRETLFFFFWRDGRIDGDTAGIKTPECGNWRTRRIINRWILLEELDGSVLRDLSFKGLSFVTEAAQQIATDNFPLFLSSAVGVPHDPACMETQQQQTMVLILAAEELVFKIDWVIFF